MTEGSDPLEVLSDEGRNSKMVSEGLPSDRVSLENGAVLTNCKRWPLLIDPQAQAIKWLKKKEEGNLDIIQLTQKNWLKILENAITNGRCVIIENIGEDIDATLDPVLSRSIYKKGRTLYLKLGGEEVEYDQPFNVFADEIEQPSLQARDCCAVHSDQLYCNRAWIGGSASCQGC